MARFLKFSGLTSKLMCPSPNLITKRYTAQLTIAVREKIEATRKKAVLGGGQQRIDAQHKKVRFITIFLLNFVPK
jgi:hypothetical protein